MPKLTIQIAKLEDPSVNAAGLRFAAKAYDTAGTKYTVPKNLTGMLKEGGWYEIFFEEESFQGSKPYNKIHSINATAPLTVSTTNPAPPSAVRARTPKEDEAQINRRHRLATVFQTLGSFAGQLPLTYEGLAPVANVLAQIYDHLAEDGEEASQRANGPVPSGLPPKAAAYGTGPAPGGDDMNEEIPF